MKRISLILASVLLLSIILVGCGSKTTNSSVDNKSDNISGKEVSSQQPNAMKNSNESNTVDSSEKKQADQIYQKDTRNSLTTVPKDLFSYLSLTKDDMIKKFGKNYQVVNYDNGYYYKDIGLTFFIAPGNPSNKVNMVQCDNKVEIFGTRAGMSFNQIKSKFNEVNLKDKLVFEPLDDGYRLRYSSEKYIINYESAKEDGSGSRVFITTIRK